MIPAPIDFLLRTNADYSEELPFMDGETPVDLTGLSFAAQVRRFPGGPLVFSLTITPFDPVNGIARVQASRTVIHNAYNIVTGQQAGPDVSLVHDIIVTHADGFREPWGAGKVVISAGVTTNV